MNHAASTGYPLHDYGVPLGAGMLEAVGRVVTNDLAPLAAHIDTQGLYPEDILRKLGASGCYAAHVPNAPGAQPDLCAAIKATATIAEECLSTAFCVWCQNACAWYLYHTENFALRARLLEPIATGKQLGGTGLSNPMKAFSDLEPVRLQGKNVSGGYTVDGRLPFISNLGTDHPFGIIFEVAGDRRVMALASATMPGVSGSQGAKFCALEGTRTWSLRFTEAMIPDDMLLADPAEDFVRRIRPGFVLLQMGLGIGLIRSCIRIMYRSARSQAGVNVLLDEQPDTLDAELADLENSAYGLATLSSDGREKHLLDILDTRLMISELALRAARGAMLHTGARGYLASAAPQRKLREAFFLAILTPAVKHLRHDIKRIA